MIEKILKTDSGNVHYWITENIFEDRKTIFFLHGLTASHDLFSKQTEYFSKDYKTLGFLFECLCIRDLKIYSSAKGGRISYYHDRMGLEADAVLHLEDGRYALIEIKLGQTEVDEGAEHLNKIERLIKEHNENEKQVPLRLPDLKIVITGTQYGYRREDGVFVIPLGCLKD